MDAIQPRLPDERQQPAHVAAHVDEGHAPFAVHRLDKCALRRHVVALVNRRADVGGAGILRQRRQRTWVAGGDGKARQLLLSHQRDEHVHQIGFVGHQEVKRLHPRQVLQQPGDNRRPKELGGHAIRADIGIKIGYRLPVIRRFPVGVLPAREVEARIVGILQRVFDGVPVRAHAFGERAAGATRLGNMVTPVIGIAHRLHPGHYQPGRGESPRRPPPRQRENVAADMPVKVMPGHPAQRIRQRRQRLVIHQRGPRQPVGRSPREERGETITARHGSGSRLHGCRFHLGNAHYSIRLSYTPASSFT
ncbi:MAG: hypothetical protein BWY76_02270 [bacterium ADurb.Bin429]|nr:MAG: hypothetical protein BWY76_02270 [bacterium ADurb.Bin429]